MLTMFMLLRTLIVLELLLTSSKAAYNWTSPTRISNGSAEVPFKHVSQVGGRMESSNLRYQLNFNKLSLYDAFDYCHGIGMQLASIKSETELQTFMKLYNDAIPQGPNLLNRGSVWLGGTDFRIPGVFAWDTLPPVRLEFTYWREGEPNNASGLERCLETLPLERFRWNDANCEEKHEFACEKTE